MLTARDTQRINEHYVSISKLSVKPGTKTKSIWTINAKSIKDGRIAYEQ